MSGDAADAERLWLETLQLVTARVSHELKGALNGVSVNLEVVRGRSARPDQPASGVARFAAAAAAQLDEVIDMNEALLSLGRRPREPVDPGAVLLQLSALLVPVGRAAGSELTVALDADGVPASAAVPPVMVRSVLGRALLGAIDAGGGDVQLSGHDGTAVLSVAARNAAPVLDETVVAAARRAGMGIEVEGKKLTLTFPAAAPPQAPVETATHGPA